MDAYYLPKRLHLADGTPGWPGAATVLAPSEEPVVSRQRVGIGVEGSMVPARTPGAGSGRSWGGGGRAYPFSCVGEAPPVELGDLSPSPPDGMFRRFTGDVRTTIPKACPRHRTPSPPCESSSLSHCILLTQTQNASYVTFCNDSDRLLILCVNGIARLDELRGGCSTCARKANASISENRGFHYR